MIELVSFSKSYSSQKKSGEMAVTDVSFKCEEGKVTGLVGENGSGKSTIIKAITGNHYATSGKVIVEDRNGKVIDAAEKPEEIKRITGYVPENPVLPPDMKVRDFINYAASIYGNSDPDFVKNVTVKCGIETVLDKKIKTLSKGFRQRVSFSQALVSNPSILVLDEPFSGLDPAQIIQMRNLILSEAKSKTVLISTHNLSEVHNLCDSVIVMKHGRKAAEGSEEEIIKSTGSQSFEEAFLKL